ncbi:hypothetical protein N175_17115 [Vibrio anguillarum M3]|nr:hypothetical protein N175_17115 [Vibrio anguillarum M3]
MLLVKKAILMYELILIWFCVYKLQNRQYGSGGFILISKIKM